MKHTLCLTLCCVVLFPISALRAQPPVDLPRFTLAATAVGTQETSDLYWMDVEFLPDGTRAPRYEALPVALGNRGRAVRPPVSSSPRLYRRTETEDGTGRFEPVITLPPPEAEDSILLLFYRKESGDGDMMILDDSPEAHPGGTVRIANLTPGRCAISLGGAPMVVQAGAQRLLGTPPGGVEQRFPLEFAAEISGNPAYAPPVKRLRLRTPQHRLLIVFSFFPLFDVTPEGQTIRTGYQPRAYRLYDRVLTDPEDGADSSP